MPLNPAANHHRFLAACRQQGSLFRQTHAAILPDKNTRAATATFFTPMPSHRDSAGTSVQSAGPRGLPTGKNYRTAAMGKSAGCEFDEFEDFCPIRYCQQRLCGSSNKRPTPLLYAFS
jgi:hypothetical protein